MKKLLKSLPVLVLILTSHYASAQISKQDNNEILTSSKTYAFYINESNQSNDNKLNNRLIVNAIEKEMQEKGLTKSENPDISIIISTQYIQEKKNYQNKQNSFGIEKANNERSSYAALNKRPNGIKYSSNCYLDIEFINTKNKTSIYKNSGSKNIGRSFSSIKEKEIQISKLVNTVL